MTLIFCSLSNFLLSQDSILIKQDLIKGIIEKTYLKSDSSIEIFKYTKNNKLVFVKAYTNTTQNIEHGKWIELYTDGSIKCVQHYDNGEPMGKWLYFAKNGDIIEEFNYDFELKFAEEKVQNSDSITFPFVEQQAKFNGGDIELFRQYLQKHLHIDRLTFDKFIGSGRHIIKVAFTIESDGNLNDIYIYNNHEPILEKEVARVIRESPTWSPATLNRKPVLQRFVMPAIFVFP